MSLGSVIRQRREGRRLTQDQVARQAGISKPYLSNIETGKAKNPPSDKVLRAIESSLDFDRGELIRLAHMERTPPDVRAEHVRLTTQVRQLRAALRGLMAHYDASLAEPEGRRAEGLEVRLHELLDERPVGKEGPLSIEALAELVLGEQDEPRDVAVPIINRVAAGYPQHFTDLDYPPSVADDYIRCPDLHDAEAFATRVVGDSMAPTYREGDIVIFSPGTPPRAGDDCFVRFADDAGTTFKRFYRDDEATVRLQPLNSAYPAETYPQDQITGLWPAVYRIEKLRKG